jgi:TDG/mug DNA glycosylase family protein
LFKPTKAQIQAAYGRTVPDVIAPGLKVLFCGINPGLYSGAVGHHFARPGNRFWKALCLAGSTPRLLLPSDERELLGLGFGITNLVGRATAAASEVARAELVAGVRALEAKAQHFHPRCVAVLGLGAYRTAFGRPRAGIGLQAERLGPSRLWVLPNPSGLNGHYQLARLAELFAELRQATEVSPGVRSVSTGRETC